MLAALAVVLSGAGAGGELAVVQADSMEPGLHDGDNIVVDHITYHFRRPRVGEIVIAQDPRDGHHIIKRVVAVAGDTVELYDGRLLRNGAVVDEPFVEAAGMAGYFHAAVTVPADHVYLLGDHRSASTDSRAFGPVPLEVVTGRYLLTVW